MCYWNNDVASGMPPNSESADDGRRRTSQTNEELVKVNDGMRLLTDLCPAMTSDSLAVIRGSNVY